MNRIPPSLRMLGFIGWLLMGIARCAVFADEPISFNRQIRPILSDACFQCHGPDERQRKAGLRLDQRDSAAAPAESGSIALVPGNSAQSELFRRLVTDDESLHMPPKDSGKHLTAQQIQLLKRWIEQGAEYQPHWAFIAPKQLPLPNAGRTQSNPIDAWIDDRLTREGLVANPRADKTTLIRRVTLDLTGLPPTLAEIDSFLSDSSTGAYERVVDRLLESDRYGEMMAQQWLDFARFADSNGYQSDSSRNQWPWRDWLIDAFNRNLPFDQFTIEQLAGDMLPDATRDQLVATGFNRNHRLNGEGGIIAEEWRVETVIDRVETTGTTWLGLTLNCCRCHDHKYDPISQREFYQLFAFFNNITESGTLESDAKNTAPILSLMTSAQEARSKEFESLILEAERKLASEQAKIESYVQNWEPGFKAKLSEGTLSCWQPFTIAEVKSEGGAIVTSLQDDSYLVSGDNPAHDTYVISGPIAAGTLTGLLLECLPDKSLPNESLGRYPNGNFVLSKIEAEVNSPELKRPLKAKFARAEATYSQERWNIGLVLDDVPNNGWAVDGPVRRDPTSAMFLIDGAITVPAQAQLTVRLKHEALSQHNIGRFRLKWTSFPPSTVKFDGVSLPDSLKVTLELPAEQRTELQKSELHGFFKANFDNPIKQAELAIADWKKQRTDFIGQIPSVMVMQEGPVRTAHILNRGEYDKPGDTVQAALPAALPPMPPGSQPDRLGLAKWIVDPSNPLTARVWVNRAWEKFFGTGLVKTTENLGSQAEYPSHPELLDWLAAEFSQGEHRWDMKSIQKQILMSDAYQRSSRRSESSAEKDPENRLLARGPRFRLSAETLRDQALFVSGLLSEKIGGPSVRPYMPEGVWDETSRYGDLRGYQNDHGANLYRRTMYTIWKRTAAPPMLLLFDAPNRELCTVKRSRTNTPLQALALLNEMTFVESARQLASRMITEGGSHIDDRLQFGFRLVTSRLASPAEHSILKRGLEYDLQQFRAKPQSAEQLLKIGESPTVNSIDHDELAAYSLTANILLNLDEVVNHE